MVSDILREAREAIHSMWDGRCKVIEFVKEKGRNNIVEKKEKVFL